MCIRDRDNGKAINITASFGVIATKGERESIDTLMEKVDKALYHAKESGKNRICGVE